MRDTAVQDGALSVHATGAQLSASTAQHCTALHCPALHCTAHPTKVTRHLCQEILAIIIFHSASNEARAMLLAKMTNTEIIQFTPRDQISRGVISVFSVLKVLVSQLDISRDKNTWDYKESQLPSPRHAGWALSRPPGIPGPEGARTTRALIW
jgi:hypothetical protein